MKKKISALICAAVVALTCALPAFAAGESPEVYVCISDGSTDNGVELTWDTVRVSDCDGDGTLTINDALYSAHEEYFEGGAAAGYAFAHTDYGISLNRLWGVENGGCYGYYLNYESPLSLSDPITGGDYIYAYAMSDLEGWSDMFTCFSLAGFDTHEGLTNTLTLTGKTYDADWNPVTIPVEGARILIDGEDSGVVTDAKGEAEIIFENAGEFVVTAVSDNAVLVPPVCVVNVEADNSPLHYVAKALLALFTVIFSIALIFKIRRIRRK